MAEIFLLLYFLGQPYINLFFTVGIIPQKIHFLSLVYCFILYYCSCIVAIFKVLKQLVAPL